MRPTFAGRQHVADARGVLWRELRDAEDAMSSRQPPKAELERFGHWLDYMDQALARFREFAPAIALRLDFTPASLDVLEAHLLAAFASIDAMDQAPTEVWDAYGRYVGEVFRRTLGGRWELYWNKPSDVHHGRPVILGYPKQQVALDAHGLVTAALHRRTGAYLSGVLQAQSEL